MLKRMKKSIFPIFAIFSFLDMVDFALKLKKLYQVGSISLKLPCLWGAPPNAPDAFGFDPPSSRVSLVSISESCLQKSLSPQFTVNHC